MNNPNTLADDDSWMDFVGDLIENEADLQIVKTAPTKKPTGYSPVRFKCESCRGTGFWQGGTNRHGNSKCNACHGLGYFVTSQAERDKIRAAKISKKNRTIDEGVQAFKAAHPDMFKELMGANRYPEEANGFIVSIAQQLFSKGFLTENQTGAWYRGKAKLAQIQEARKVESAAKSGQADLTPIRKMFETAVSNGFKKPIYRAEGLKISLAPTSGRNAGALYVVEIEGDAYQGKVFGVQFQAVGSANSETLPRLQAIAANPFEAAVRFGQRTGTCSCCGRKLTNKISIDLGIGPVCREKWGL